VQLNVCGKMLHVLTYKTVRLSLKELQPALTEDKAGAIRLTLLVSHQTAMAVAAKPMFLRRVVLAIFAGPVVRSAGRLVFSRVASGAVALLFPCD